MTARDVPKAILVASVGSIPVEVSAHICTGTIMKPPPTPSRPQKNPTIIPVASSTRTYIRRDSAIKFLSSDLELPVLRQNLIRQPVKCLEIGLFGVSLGHYRIEKLQLQIGQSECDLLQHLAAPAK